MKKLSINLLVSGDLGFTVLEHLFKSENKLSSVFTNKHSNSIIDFCKIKNIPIFIGNPRNGKATNFLSGISSDITLSVNYLFLIEQDLIDHAIEYAINLHGSLLPTYKGRTPHVWAIINGEPIAGVTAHLMELDVDSGDIIKQKIVEIDSSETGDTLLQKYKKLYPVIIEEILVDIQNNNVKTDKQDIDKATYFGKRTPDDGLIDWNWSKERIRNWIRAQAHPYPGAFSYYENKKITINKAEISEFGYHYNDANGLIIKVEKDNIFVKTPNGTLKLSGIILNDSINFVEGKILK